MMMMVKIDNFIDVGVVMLFIDFVLVWEVRVIFLCRVRGVLGVFLGFGGCGLIRIFLRIVVGFFFCFCGIMPLFHSLPEIP